LFNWIPTKVFSRNAGGIPEASGLRRAPTVPKLLDWGSVGIPTVFSGRDFIAKEFQDTSSVWFHKLSRKAEAPVETISNLSQLTQRASKPKLNVPTCSGIFVLV
jgi:hypothetical protein